MESILNYSDIDIKDINNIMTLLVEDIESYLNSNEHKYGYLLNQYINFELDGIHMNIYIHKYKSNNKYYYDLTAKNFGMKIKKKKSIYLQVVVSIPF